MSKRIVFAALIVVSCSNPQKPAPPTEGPQNDFRILATHAEQLEGRLHVQCGMFLADPANCIAFLKRISEDPLLTGRLNELHHRGVTVIATECKGATASVDGGFMNDSQACIHPLASNEEILAVLRDSL